MPMECWLYTHWLRECYLKKSRKEDWAESDNYYLHFWTNAKAGESDQDELFYRVLGVWRFCENIDCQGDLGT